MIALPLGRIVNSIEPMKTIVAAKLPIKTAYQLSRIAKALQAELALYDEQREKLIVELGEKQEAGGVKVTDANLPAFLERMNELLAVDVSIDVEPVKVDALGDKAEVSANDLLACEAFIVA